MNDCVYCGVVGRNTDEHTIPYSVWGRDQLLGGSCQKCQKRTAKIEDHVFRVMFGRAREFLRAPTKKAYKQGRRTGESIAITSDGGEIKIPIHLALPNVAIPYGNYLPRNLHYGEPESNYEHVSISTGFLKSSPQMPRGVGEIIISDQVNMSSFFRVVAKIAYCEFIRTVDASFRNRAVGSYITEGTGKSFDFVGGAGPSDASMYLHEVSFQLFRNRDQNLRPILHIVANVRLFSFLKTPTLIVHLGHTSIDNSYDLPVLSIENGTVFQTSNPRSQ